MSTDVAGPDGSALSEGLGLAPERAEVERLAKWLEDAAWSDAATSFHEYEQAAAALRGLQRALDAAVAAERERIARVFDARNKGAGRLLRHA